MVKAGDIRNGMTFELNGKVYQVIEFLHVKPGKGAAFVRIKMKDVMNGGVTEDTFNPDDKFPKAHIERKQMEYLYNDGDMCYFMDPESYDQIPVAMSQAEDALKYLKDNETATLSFYKGSVFAIEPPLTVELLVTETEPGAKGNTATNVTKPATVETGAEIKVPIFVNEGDRIKIDTRTGEYLQRA